MLSVASWRLCYTEHLNSDHICVKYKNKVCLFLLDVAVYVSAALASVLVKALFNLTYISRLLPKLSIPELCAHAVCLAGCCLCSWCAVTFYSIKLYITDHHFTRQCRLLLAFVFICKFYQYIWYILLPHLLSSLSSLHPSYLRLMPKLCESH